MDLTSLQIAALLEAKVDYHHGAMHEDDSAPKPVGERHIDVHAQFDGLAALGLLELVPYVDGGGSGMRYALTDSGVEALKGLS